ncbi:MAG: BspA family leucine-rich repeat surface protein, partial [Muribaculaceae bacterium]|nr:BspA family leucine-rich repeat surface protein [Muribaculaceae bacterium]
MKQKKLPLRLAVLVAAMLCALGAKAVEAYACYTPSNTTLTFYYDNQRSSRPGTTYDLNTGANEPGWKTDGTVTNVTKVVFAPSFADARPTTTYFWFDKMENLQSITGLSYLNTSQVTNMGHMFSYCYKLTSIELSGFNTSKVTDMVCMFYNCESLMSLDLSSFNTSKVTNMQSMFYGCSSLTSLDLSSFSTSNVANMYYMFSYCTNLQTITVGSGWSTAAVTSSTNMFKNCTSLVGGQGTTYDANHVDKTYAHIDGGTSNPGYFTEWEAYACYTPLNTTLTFYYDNERSGRTGTTYDLNTGANDPGWKTDGTVTNVTKVVFAPSFADARPTSTYYWFYGMQNLQTIVGMKEYLNTSQVTDMRCMFILCSGLTSLDLSRFDTSKVTDMSSMFSNCSGLTSLDLSSFDTRKVTNMSSMFSFCSGLMSVNLLSFNTSQVADMKNMFIDCQNLRTIYAGYAWSTAAVTSSSMMFFNCTSLVGGMGTTYDYIHYNKDYAHLDGGPSDPGYFTLAGTEAYACYTSWNSTLTFYFDDQRDSRSGTTYDLNEDDTGPGWEADGTNEFVTQVVFDSSFANASPTTTFSWFYDMRNLESITGMEYLNTSQVTNMGSMFSHCWQLTSLDLSTFNTSKVTNMRSMFYQSWQLRSLDLSSFNTSKMTNMMYMFEGCTHLITAYVGSGWSTAAVQLSTSMFSNCRCLVGGQGTTYDESNPVDKTYAHLDGGPSNPGYFTVAGTEAYACYTPSNTTLTFYYDTERSSRTGTTYDLNTDENSADWNRDGSYRNVTQVVFDPSFAIARPLTTFGWFSGMTNLESITGMNYLNTSVVTDMVFMFRGCSLLASLDLSH